jgi:hypothetical protein
MPGKTELRWLIGCFAAFICFWSAWAYFVPASDPAPPAVVTAGLPEVPLSVPLVIHPETVASLAGRFGPVPAAAEPVPAAPIVTVAPAAPVAVAPAPQASRCERLAYLVRAPKREGILDDMETKYRLAYEMQRRQSIAYSQCLREAARDKDR